MKTRPYQQFIRTPADHVARATLQYDDEELINLVVWHNGYCIARKISPRQCAEEIGLEFDLITRVWLADATPDELKSFTKAVVPFREQVCEKQRLQFRYYENQYSEEIVKVFHATRRRSERGQIAMSFIDGDAGCGKTTIAKALCASYNHGWTRLFTPKPMGGDKALIYDCAEMLGIDCSQNQHRTLNRVYSWFRPGMVLIIDEAHRLIREDSERQKHLELFRDIADRTGAGMMLLSTDGKFEKWIAETDYNQRQYWRRQCRIIHLPRLAPDDQVIGLFKFKCPGLPLADKTLKAMLTINHDDKGGYGAVAIAIDDALDLAIESDTRLAQKYLDLAFAKKLEALA
jgi:DNA transposition AAA+ family ATPase